MKIVGLITEYNPFHNGHKHHLIESKKTTYCNYSIAVMSGNFLQRGEPAIVDKWTRAKMAVDNGVDLVIELPTIYACQSAEYFSYGAVKLLDSLNVVNSICFGSELGQIDELNLIAKVLLDEPVIFKEYLKEHLLDGNSYPKARSYALMKYFDEVNVKGKLDISKILSSPNNILSIEYLKTLNKLKSEIIPFTIDRIISNYNETNLTGSISSATAIRKSIFENSLTSVKEAISYKTYSYLEEFYDRFNEFNRLENYSSIINYLLKVSNKNDLIKIVDLDEDLYNRIISCSIRNNNIRDILNCTKTKRYTYTRLQRVMIHILLNFKNDMFEDFLNVGPQYVRVLASNENGLKIIKEIKNKCSLPIITKFSNFKDSDNKHLKDMLMIDKLCTDIYFSGLSKDIMKTNLDFLTSPYIKKK